MVDNLGVDIKAIVKECNILCINVSEYIKKQKDKIVEIVEEANRQEKLVVLNLISKFDIKNELGFVEDILKKHKFSLVIGNSSDVADLINYDNKSDKLDFIKAAKIAANRYNTVVCLAGAIDYISDGNIVYVNYNGSVMTSCVWGYRHIASAIVTSFIASHPEDVLKSVAVGLAYFGYCGKNAAQISKGIGSFSINLLDELYYNSRESLKIKGEEKLSKKIKLEVV